MAQPKVWLGVSLKMYFGYQQTLAWCRDVAGLAQRHPAIQSGEIGLFVLPAYPAIPAVAEIFADTPVRFGGQDVCQAENGAWTGEVSASMLQELRPIRPLHSARNSWQKRWHRRNNRACAAACCLLTNPSGRLVHRNPHLTTTSGRCVLACASYPLLPVLPYR